MAWKKSTHAIRYTYAFGKAIARNERIAYNGSSAQILIILSKKSAVAFDSVS